MTSEKHGWISLHRRLLDWEWYSDISTTRLFIHMLLRANHKPKKWQGVDVPAGSFLSGRKQLALETGLTEQQVRTSIIRLKSTSELTTKSTSRNTLFTLVSWDRYQSNQPANQPATNQQLTTNNNDNNDNNKKIYNDHFDSVWNLYPRKIAKKAAYKSYVAALRRGEDAEQIKLGVMNYARQIELDGTAPNYVLHGSTFFSQDRYKDYVDAACTTNTDFSLDSKPHTTTPVAPSAGSAGLPKIPLSEIRAMQEHFDDKRAVVRYYRGGHDEAFRKFAKVGIDRVVDDVDGQ